MRLPGVLSPWLLIFTGCLQLSAQAVVSTHSGLINYHEGAVFLDDQPLEQKFGAFSSLKQGSTLRTEKGRVEILLTPGVFLRVDENSAIRMLSNSLTDTRVEFLRGAVILDSNAAAAPAPGSSLVMTYKTYELRFPKPGVYRLDSEPEILETYTGEAEVIAQGQAPKTIDESHQFFFGIGAETNKYGDGAIDNFSEWARNRAETIAADNEAAAQSTAPLPDPGAGLSGSVYGSAVPVPVPSYGLPGLGQYGSTMVYDNGFYGSYGPFGPWFPGPAVVIYAFPRLYSGIPVHGTPPRRPGYPIVPPIRTGYPRPYPYRPTPIPLRTGVTSLGVNRMPVTRAPIPHVTPAPSPRFAAPGPRFAAPTAPRSVGIGAIHHR